MTKEQKLEAYALLLDGCTYAEVGKKLGYSQQHIQQMFPGITERGLGRRPRGIYPNIERWIKENRLTRAAFGKKLGCCDQTTVHYLNGKRQPDKETIDKILSLTGMTYEEAFKQ